MEVMDVVDATLEMLFVRFAFLHKTNFCRDIDLLRLYKIGWYGKQWRLSSTYAPVETPIYRVSERYKCLWISITAAAEDAGARRSPIGVKG